LSDHAFTPPDEVPASQISVLSLLFGFEGRITRGEYVAGFFGWLGLLVFFLGGRVLVGLRDEGLSSLLLLVLYCWPNLALHIKRFHDLGWSGLAAWFVLFIPCIGQLVGLGLCALLPGVDGPNPYGPDPRDPDAVRGVSSVDWDPAVEDALRDDRD
jgi:uncharacterized membrane protein YhaH (DUF805 family)